MSTVQRHSSTYSHAVLAEAIARLRRQRDYLFDACELAVRWVENPSSCGVDAFDLVRVLRAAIRAGGER